MRDRECNGFLRPYAAWTRHSSAHGRVDSVSQKGIAFHVSGYHW